MGMIVDDKVSMNRFLLDQFNGQAQYYQGLYTDRSRIVGLISAGPGGGVWNAQVLEREDA
jgi:hypothetical protein